MAAKPSTAAKEALQKIQEQVTCGICLDFYKQPKLLKCCHVYCQECLQRLVGRRAGLPCPQCRKVTPLPVGGVENLQGAFHHNALLDIYKMFKNSGNNCPKHPEKEVEFFCEKCNQLLCSYCLLPKHRHHQYDLLAKLFAKHNKVIVNSLKPVKKQIATLEGAIKSVDTRCAAIVEQKTAVVAEIHTAMAHLRQVLEVRETELVGQAEQTAQQKLKSLAAQRDRFELQLGQLKSCHDFVEESQRTCSQGEILGMKTLLVKQINELMSSFKPETLTLTLAEQADMRFGHSLPELVKTCQQFGKVYCSFVCPEKCQASGKGIKAASRGQTVTVSVEVLDREGEACLKAVEGLMCELVAGSRVRGTVKRRNANRYDVSYQSQATGEYQLHILIEEQPILNSPFTVTIIPNLTAPADIIGHLEKPWGIAIMEGGQMVVAEFSCACISIFRKEKKKSFGAEGSGPGQFNQPKGVEIDVRGNILVADCDNHRIQQLSSTGKHLETVGACGSEPLQFRNPGGIAVHPHTNKMYVAEWGNHRIQVLNSDLTYSSSFGMWGSNNGQFALPHDLSTDSDSNVYVADCDNHRIQVFTADGVYLRQFGKKGEGEGELKYPVSIAIDSHNVAYVGELGNNSVSIFSTDGEFITSFGREGEGPLQFKNPFGLAVDKNGTLYICDTFNNRIQLIT